MYVYLRYLFVIYTGYNQIKKIVIGVLLFVSVSTPAFASDLYVGIKTGAALDWIYSLCNWRVYG